MSRMHN